MVGPGGVDGLASGGDDSWLERRDSSEGTRD